MTRREHPPRVTATPSTPAAGSGGPARPTLRVEHGHLLVPVRVVPRASQVALTVEPDGLRVRLTAPPVEGAANAALIALLAERLRLPRHAVMLVRGASTRHKVLAIAGIESEEFWRRLNL